MDATRGIAAICVMLFHYTYHHTDGALFPSATIAVDYFFCLSGFVIAHSYGNKLQRGMTASTFMWLRLVRLYPMYLLGTLIGLAAAVLYWFIEDLNTWRSFVGALMFAAMFLPYLRYVTVREDQFLTSNYFFPLNPPAWSLFFEIAVNLLYAHVRFEMKWLLAALAVAYVYIAKTTYTFQGPAGFSIENFIGGAPRVFFSFYVGTLLHQLWTLKTCNHLTAGPIAPCIMVIVMCLVPETKPGLLGTILIVIPLTVWLSTATPRNPVVVRLFAILGDISYPVYALHWPCHWLAQGLYTWLTKQPPSTVMPLWLVGATAVGVVASSFILSKVYDAPIRRWLLRPVAKKNVSATAS